MTANAPHHNPAFLPDADLVQRFVVREDELRTILEIVWENTAGSNRHVLAVGARGMGKTMLVRRVAVEVTRDPVLSKRVFPLVFSEESYLVGSAGELWLEALRQLSLQTREPRWAEAHETLRRTTDERTLRDACLARLMDFADERKARLLIVVENFSMLFEEQISKDAGWDVRDTLQNEPRIMLLATATSTFDQVESSKEAFFELFRMVRLEPLVAGACATLWQSLSGEPLDPARARAVRILTGGSPRLLSVLCGFAKGRSFSELMDDLARLVDDHTPYFKARLDALPNQERRVFVALADIWEPATASAVAEGARVDVNMASALLGRLVRRGAVVEVGRKGRRVSYQVADRLYNIYHLLRSRGTQADRVRALVDFMAHFYRPQELGELIDEIALQSMLVRRREDHHAAVLQLQQHLPIRQRRRLVARRTEEISGLELVVQIRQQLYGSGRAPTETRQAVTRGSALRSLKHASDLITAGDTASAEEVLRRALERHPRSWATRRALSEVLKVHGRAEECRQVLLGEEDALAAVEVARELMFAGFPDDALRVLDTAPRAFRSTAGWKVERARALQAMPGRSSESEAILRAVLADDPDDVGALSSLATLPGESPHRDERERLLRHVTELSPSSALHWRALGDHLLEAGAFADAEAAFKQGWSLDGGVGGLVDVQIARREWREAERLIDEAAGHGRERAILRVNLGVALFKEGRLDDAERLFRTEVGTGELLVPALHLKWHGLVLERLGRYAEAEEVLLGAALREPDSGTWLVLGDARRAQGKADLAFEAYEQALASTLVSQPSVGKTVEVDASRPAARLAALGHGAVALRMLRESSKAAELEPLVVALALESGEEVMAPAEVLEVAGDLRTRIEELRREPRPAAPVAPQELAAESTPPWRTLQRSAGRKSGIERTGRRRSKRRDPGASTRRTPAG